MVNGEISDAPSFDPLQWVKFRRFCIANRPDDSGIIGLATVVGMNSVIQVAIEEPSDTDVFKIESLELLKKKATNN